MKSQVVRRGFIGLVVIWSAIAGVAAPTEYVWTGEQDAYWTNAANWQVDGQPARVVPGQYFLPNDAAATNRDAIAVFGVSGAERTTVDLAGLHFVSGLVVRAGAPAYTFGSRAGQYLGLASAGGFFRVEAGAKAPTVKGVYGLIYEPGMSSSGPDAYDAPDKEARFVNDSDETLVLENFGNRAPGVPDGMKTLGYFRPIGLGGSGNIKISSWVKTEAVLALNLYPEKGARLMVMGTSHDRLNEGLIRNIQIGGGRQGVIEIYEKEFECYLGIEAKISDTATRKMPPIVVRDAGTRLTFTGAGSFALRGSAKEGTSWGSGFLRAAADVATGAELVFDCAVAPFKSLLYGTPADPREGFYLRNGGGTVRFAGANTSSGGIDLLSTSVAGATLTFDSLSGFGTGPVRLGQGACLAYTGAEALAFAQPLVLTNGSINLHYAGAAAIPPTATVDVRGTGALTVASTLDVSGTGTDAVLTLANATATSAVWTGLLADAADGSVLSVVKTGAGTWTLGAGTHTFSGGLDVAGGTLALAAEATLAAPVTLANDTTLSLAQSQRLAALNVSGTARIVLADGVELTLGSVVAAAGARLKIVPGAGARVRIEGANAIPDYLFVCGADGRSVGSAIDAEGWITAMAPTVWTGAAAADWTAEENWSRGVPSTALPARIDLPDATPVVPADTTAPTAGTIDLAAGTLKVLGTLPVTIAEESARFVVGSAATLALAGAGQVQANAAAGVNDYALSLAGGTVTVQDTAHLDLTGSRGLLGTGCVTIDSVDGAALYVMGSSTAYTRLSTGDDPGTLEIVTGRGGFYGYGKEAGYLVIGDDQRGTLRMRVTDAGTGKDSAAVVAGLTPRRTTIGARRGRAEVELASGTLKSGNWGIWLGAADTDTSAVTGRVTVAGGSMSISSGYYDGSWSGLAVGIASQPANPACVAGELILSSGSVSVGNKSPLGLGIAAACGLVRQTGGTFTMSANQGVTVLGYGSGTGVWEMSGGTFSSSRPLYIGGCSQEELQLSPAFSAPAACAPGRRAAHGRFAAQGGTVTLTHELGAIVGADGPGRLEIGAEAVFTTSALALKGADATLAFTLGADGAAGSLTAAKLVIANGAQLEIDATRLASVARSTFRLAQCGEVAGAFAPENVTVCAPDGQEARFAEARVVTARDGQAGLWLKVRGLGLVLILR